MTKDEDRANLKEGDKWYAELMGETALITGITRDGESVAIAFLNSRRTSTIGVDEVNLYLSEPFWKKIE